LQYAKAREAEQRAQMKYKLYVADSLFYSQQNMRLAERFSDILNKKRKEMQEKTGDEIVQDIITKHGFKFKKGGET
jgi:hypothetical protein